MRGRLARWIGSLFVVALATRASAAADPVVRDGLGARADSVLRAQAERGFSGVVLIAQHGEVVLEQGYGMADRAERIPMRAGTVVQIGSNTKDFTIVAILQLRERGKLALEDPLPKFFPDAPADKRGITIEQLLRHTAGFPQYLGGDFEAVSRDEMLRQAFASKLLFEPGSSRSYSNVGYSILAAILERITGVSYDEYVAANILRPLGLRETGSQLPRFDRRRAAHGYRGDEDRGLMFEKPHAADGPYWHLRGNGGMLSTVSDMWTFYRALMDSSRLLAPASRNLLFHPRSPGILAGSDGVCFFLYDREPESGLDIFVATNSSEFQAPRALDALKSVLEIGGGGPGPGQVAIDRGAPPKRPDGVLALPETNAGQRAAAYFRAYNQGDTATIRRFIQETMAPNPEDTRTLAQRLDSYRQMFARLGTLTPLSVGSSTDTELRVEVQTQKAGTTTMIFEVESTAPNRLLSVQYRSVSD